MVLCKISNPVWNVNGWEEIHTYRDFYGQTIEVRWGSTFDKTEVMMSNGPHATNSIDYVFDKLRFDSMAKSPHMEEAEHILKRFSEWRKRMKL